MVPEADLALYRLHYDRYQQDSTPHFHTGFHWGHPVPAGAVPSYRCRRHPRVNGRFCFVFTSWDLNLPHQTHPQTPIHTFLAWFETV